MSRIVFADVETTGTDLSRHAVWEIGLVVLDGDQDTRYCWQIRPDLSTADPMALRVGRYYERCHLIANGVGAAIRVTHPSMPSRDSLHASDPDNTLPRVGGPVPSLLDAHAVAAELAPLLDGASLAAANVAFDASFLAAFLRANGQCPSWDYHLVEVESYAAGALGWVPPWKLDKLMTELGATIPEDQRHTALGDAVGIFELWKAVREGRKEVPW